MNNDGRNPGMSVEDYENMAVRKSNVAKKVAAGAGAFVAGGAIAGGVAYAAGSSAETPVADPDTVSTDDLLRGAESGADQPQVVEETRTVGREVPAPEPVDPEPEPVDPGSEEDSENHWDTTKNIYENGEYRGSIVSGVVDGHKAVIVDGTGDGLADAYAVDLNDDGVFQENEIEHLTPEEHITMESIETPETVNDVIITNPDYDINNGGLSPEIGGNEPIHNDFTDERTGETYHNDYAENNRDYNNHAGLEDFHDTGEEHHGGLGENHGFADEHHDDIEPYPETGHHDNVVPAHDGGETGHDDVGHELHYGDADHIPGHSDPFDDVSDHDYDDPDHGYDDLADDYDPSDDDAEDLSEDLDDPDDGYDDPDDGYDDPDDGYDDSDDGYDDPDYLDGMSDVTEYEEGGYDADPVDDGMDHLGGEVILG